MYETLRKAIELRRTGKIEESFLQTVELFKRFGNEPAVVSEMIKILILYGQSEEGYKLYQFLRSTRGADKFFEAEYLTRLHILTGKPVPESKTARSFSEWIKVYRRQKYDPLYSSEIINCQEFYKNGFTIYNFTLICKSCGAKYELKLRKTFLIDIEFLCFNCFARQKFDSEVIKEFVESEINIGEDEYTYLDSVISKMYIDLNNDSIAGDKFPLISRFMYIDYIFKLNELISRQLRTKLG